jgi:hypothetical protein
MTCVRAPRRSTRRPWSLRTYDCTYWRRLHDLLMETEVSGAKVEIRFLPSTAASAVAAIAALCGGGFESAHRLNCANGVRDRRPLNA